ncbi:hypothetical protein KO528_01730 [Saccharophagus degradans]|uniref:hypothetical protein n=1 Tax=Saccharophagus degradans TaxID=86304 RepID=UPI001C0959B9|nr:hypothetical protein [Saccharophagus degradans]MBU2984057.1 hypothetical protein [Saccharophagus degradans]
MHVTFLNQMAKKELAKKELNELASALTGNNKSMVVMTAAEYIDFVLAQKVRSGMTLNEAISWMDGVIALSADVSITAKATWNKYKEWIKTGGSYIPVVLDGIILVVLAREMKRGGDILSKYSVKSHSGVSYIVLEGYAGLRSKLTGTRYLASTPKVVSLGIGKLGAGKAIASGAVVSIIFTVAFHSLEQLLNEQATWHDFVGGVTVDTAAALTGGAIAWAAVYGLVGASAMVAIGPIAVVVIVGAGITAILNAISSHYGLNRKLAEMLKESEARMLKNMRNLQSEVRTGLNYANEDPVGFMHRLFAVPYFRYE